MNQKYMVLMGKDYEHLPEVTLKTLFISLGQHVCLRGQKK